MSFRMVTLPLVLLAAAPFHSSIEPLSKAQQTRLKAGGFWHKGCPVPLSGLRVLTVSHRDWEGKVTTGQLVVNAEAAPKLRRLFRRLFRAYFPVRHMRFSDMYGPGRAPNDVTASFECRQAAASPCTGKARTGSWSNHAYGLAVDLNPRENPYVGCGMSRDPTAQRYRDRSVHRRGMVTARVRAAFAREDWEWGGAWAGDTKDYMHFSHNGH